jgi:hypothetical protein
VPYNAISLHRRHSGIFLQALGDHLLPIPASALPLSSDYHLLYSELP